MTHQETNRPATAAHSTAAHSTAAHPKRARRTASLRAAAFRAAAFWFAAASCAVAVRPAVAAGLPSHFIVLIDDSADMGSGGKPQRIIEDLPKLLYGETAGLFRNRPGDPPAMRFPTIDPGRDLVDVAFYGLSDSDGSGKNAPRFGGCRDAGYDWNTFRSDQLLRWLPASGGRMGRQAFENALTAALSAGAGGSGNPASCRFKHRYSPISTASLLAVPSAGERLHARSDVAQIGRVFVVNVTNLLANVNPSEEIAYFVRTLGTSDSEWALDRTRSVQSLFNFYKPPDWLITWEDAGPVQGYGALARNMDKNKLRVQIAEARPLGGSVDALVSFPRSMRLEKAAQSADRTALIPQPGSEVAAVVRADARRPVLHVWRDAADASSKTHHATDLTRCAGPCRTTDDGALELNMLALPGVVGEYPAGENIPFPAKIESSVLFRYETGGVYDHVYQWTSPVATQTSVAPDLELGRGSLCFDSIRAFCAYFDEKYLPALRFDETTLANLLRGRGLDGPLTQERAREKVALEREAWRQSVYDRLIPAAALALFAAGYAGLHAYRRRRFEPQAIWRGVSGVRLDFGALGTAPILVGTIEIVNAAYKKPFGSRDEPQCEAVVSAVGWNFAAAGFVVEPGGVPAGFAGTDAGVGLASVLRTRIADKAVTAVFVDPSRLRDFKTDGPPEITRIALSGLIDVEWKDGGRLRKALGAPVEAAFTLELHPEPARDPTVSLSVAADRLEFRGRGADEAPHRIVVGTVRVVANATRAFARPFAGVFSVRAEGPAGVLADGDVALDAPSVEAPAGATVVRNLTMLCDGGRVPNPQGAADVYRLLLTGRFDPATSQAGPFMLSLHRDATRCEPTLVVRYGDKKAEEIIWEGAGRQARRRALNHDALAGTFDEAACDNLLTLPLRRISFEDRSPPAALCELDVGGAGRVGGKGRIDVHFRAFLDGAPFILSAIELEDGESLAAVVDESGVPIGDRLSIADGDATRRLRVELATGVVRSIKDCVIEAGKIEARVEMRFDAVADDGASSTSEFTVAVPLRLEQLPQRNWLCIDFGTSAIAVAQGFEDEVEIIQLQRARQGEGNNPYAGACLDEYDRGNLERGTALLPGMIACDADLRQGEPADGRRVRPGFPGFHPAALTPGDPSFISLPATERQLSDMPGRVVFSLKSWMGVSSNAVILDERTSYRKADGVAVQSVSLPLDELIQSSFAALAEAYVKTSGVSAGQVVITHPNTFTRIHRERLHRNVFKALSSQLSISRPERIRLVSESDAVAHHYCRQRRRGGARRTGTETVMVYDLGAGTLDVSIIRIEWSKGPVVYPERRRTLYRLGVPTAGNHLDAAVARLAHDLLSDPKILDPKILDYCFPLVAARPAPGRDAEHARAAHRFWLAVRAAKQGGTSGRAWDGKEPLTITVGRPGQHHEHSVVALLGTAEAAEAAYERYARKGAADQPHLRLNDDDGDTRLELSIPAAVVHRAAAVDEFIRFVTEDVVDESLKGAGVAAEDVDTLIVSGRGALWPGLREKVRGRFPAGVETPTLDDDDGEPVMKEAVVRGAIAMDGTADEDEPLPDLPLAVVMSPGGDVVHEDDWGKGPIPFGDNTAFRLVQIAHRDPDPVRDMQSLRHHFYIDVAGLSFRRKGHWKDDPFLVIASDRTPGKPMTIRIGAVANPSAYIVAAENQTGGGVVSPPWPIGQTVLSP